jgi:UTP--glucose-1-phosphate uridylyltransferase
MKIRKAVITAAARGERLYPVADTVQKAMLPVVDTDGLHKPVIQIIAEEAFAGGIEEICVVCAPGDGPRYLQAFQSLRNNLLQSHQGSDWARSQAARIDHLLSRLQFVEQSEPRGYGHAVLCARAFVKDEPFLLLLGDYLYVSNLPGKRCAQQLVDLRPGPTAQVAAVNPTPNTSSAGTAPSRASTWPVHRASTRSRRSLKNRPSASPNSNCKRRACAADTTCVSSACTC